MLDERRPTLDERRFKEFCERQVKAPSNNDKYKKHYTFLLYFTLITEPKRINAAPE